MHYELSSTVSKLGASGATGPTVCLRCCVVGVELFWRMSLNRGGIVAAVMSGIPFTRNEHKLRTTAVRVVVLLVLYSWLDYFSNNWYTSYIR